MNPPLSRRVAAATCGLAAVLSSVAIAAPASAEVYAGSDPAGDVTDPSGPRPGVEQGDIRRVRFEHGRRAVTFRVGYRELARVGDGIQEYVQVDTPTDYFRIQVVASPGNWRGAVIAAPDGCQGIDFRFDYGNDRFTMSVPRSCLDSPPSVRVGLLTFTYAGDGDRGYRVDDANSRGFDFEDDNFGRSPSLDRAGGAYTG